MAPDELRARALAGEVTPVDAAGRLRIVLRAAGLLALLILCVPLHYLFRLFRLGSPWPKFFLGSVARVCGARVRTIGTPLRRDVFFVANHVSWIDILALGGASGTAFVAKAELATAPMVGWLAGLNRTVYVKRENRMGVADQINTLRNALADNWSITVFPEGTTTDNASLLPFKTPMLRVLEPPPPGVLVQPVVLFYGAVGEEIGWIGEEGGLNNARRVLSRRGSFPVEVHYLDPFDPNDVPGRKAIAAESRRRIEERLTTLLGHPPRPFAHMVEAVRYKAEPASPDA
ncbi:lysophospholipid acyltransferase family protein [Sphingomonas sp. BGYR3]|uniref:lysophospholipid acyltransferase family protein n=1 Tax=Sphingomonas sp. BGYR3 TaxID=2975483 RepID=UPI0021A7BCED|nr:lysophospholipid acyltransferase family protein [Sphingomonas sp. BGYR3]MDG5489372.1 lysophospholipid acyltransferase family protein [Sphingomonas sp. BGYR3]